MWKDPVWSKVIAAGILAVCAAVGASLLDLWPAIGRTLKSAWEYAISPSGLPNWVVWILALALVPTLIILCVLLWQAVFPGKTEPDWRSYKQDDFLGLRWRWNYLATGTIEDPAPFCPHCEYRVFPHRASGYTAVDRIGFHCDSCGRNLPEFEELFESLQSKVSRFIEQRIRTGMWKGDGST